MKPLGDNLLDAFKRSEDSEKPFVVTGTGNVIANVRALVSGKSTDVDDIREFARLIVEEAESSSTRSPSRAGRKPEPVG
jgi:hypothetical protein